MSQEVVKIFSENKTRLWSLKKVLEEQNAQQHNAVQTTDDQLPIVSSIVESLAV